MAVNVGRWSVKHYVAREQKSSIKWWLMYGLRANACCTVTSLMKANAICQSVRCVGPPRRSLQNYAVGRSKNLVASSTWQYFFASLPKAWYQTATVILFQLDFNIVLHLSYYKTFRRILFIILYSKDTLNLKYKLFTSTIVQSLFDFLVYELILTLTSPYSSQVIINTLL